MRLRLALAPLWLLGLAPPIAICLLLLQWWTPAPMLVVEMSSTANSYAQVFWDFGTGTSGSHSETVSVRASETSATLRFPLPNALIPKLRFDPVAIPATVTIRNVRILRSNGSTAVAVAPSRIRGVLGFDRMDLLPGAVRYRVRSDSFDPQLVFDIDGPIDLRSRFPGGPRLLLVFLCGIGICLLEALSVAAVRRFRWQNSVTFAAHVAATLAYFWMALPSPALIVEMSSTVYSRAQVYVDVGEGLNDRLSSSIPVRPSANAQELRMPIPHARIKYLRFDPITCPGTIVIRRATLVQSDGSVARTFPVERIVGVLGFDRMEITGNEVQYRVRSDSYDPQLILQLDDPVDLRSYMPGVGLLGKLALLNFLFGAILWGQGRRTALQFLKRLDRWAAARAKPGAFLELDRLAIWFYAVSVFLALGMTALNWNGSSMGVLWDNYKEGAPADIVAGSPKEIRADEFNYVTPAILNQVFRAQKFDAVDSVFGNHSAALVGEIPIRHYTTLVRPQYWPFFLFRADYAFSAWWQLKQLIFVTGVFTLFLALTGSSPLAFTGTAWLFFSQLTQWDYSWPSMLPEMGGTFCFTLVLALYLTVGTRRLPLLLSAVGCSACALNFVMCFYVPHLIPYAWVGAPLFAAWCIGRREDILGPNRRGWRIFCLCLCLALTALLMIPLLSEMRELIAGIAATTYPGRRVNSAGQYSWVHYGSHFLAPFESAGHFPPAFYNINEASGFLWLAPATLFCIAQMRALPRNRKWLLGGLWCGALLLLAWLSIPVPQWIGHMLFLDRVMPIRALPAFGFVNVAIVMVVLSSERSPRLFRWEKFLLSTAVALIWLLITNLNLGNFFKPIQIAIAALWAGALVAFLLRGSRKWFAAGVLIPNALLFGLVNPIQRGIGVVTSSTLFEKVQQDRRLLEGKWMVFAADLTSSPFVAVGCRVFNGSKYLPDIDHFALFEKHGVDTKVLNNLSYIDAVELAPGQPPTAEQGQYGMLLHVSPLDPLLRELGIQYLAFRNPPSAAVLAHLKSLAPGNLSEFYLYEFK